MMLRGIIDALLYLRARFRYRASVESSDSWQLRQAQKAYIVPYTQKVTDGPRLDTVEVL